MRMWRERSIGRIRASPRQGRLRVLTFAHYLSPRNVCALQAQSFRRSLPNLPNCLWPPLGVQCPPVLKIAVARMPPSRAHDDRQNNCNWGSGSRYFLTVLFLALASVSRITNPRWRNADTLFQYARNFQKIADAKCNTQLAFGACPVATMLFFAYAKLLRTLFKAP